MNADWRRTTWGELIELKYGKALRDYKNGTGEYPVFGTNGAVGSCDKALCPFPGIIIGRKGAYRGVHFSDKPFFVIDTAYYVNPKADFNIKWAYYHLLHQDINNLDSGSAIPSTSREDVYQLPAFVPPRHFQDYMVRVLDSLNEKIQINRQINQTLEQLAQAIFKSWFVDFEPVKAKIAALEADGSEEDALLAAMQAISGTSLFDADASAAGAEAELARLQAEQPEQYAELRATAELFPSAMRDSELGEIPEGWEVSNFGSVSKCFDKHRIPLSRRQREQRQGGIPYYGATSVMDYVDEPIFDGVYLLLGEDGSVLKEDGSPFTQYIWGKSWVNNHAHVLQGTNGVSTEQLYLFIGMQNIAAYVTGAVQLKLNQKNMNSIPFIKAPNDINAMFSEIITPMFGLRRKFIDESSLLSEIRDVLLPKLLSGELSLPNTVSQLGSQDVADATA